MAKNVAHLYIGEGESQSRFDFSDPHKWEAVRSQLENIATGKLPAPLRLERAGTGGTVTFLITHASTVSWVELPD
ncbi:hypothetical protein HF576_02025 [Microbacterium sp. CFH 90308]|uniref:Uncharacterized protein n=1 Tax=Microbacterium salsuginis TaxID=2722803 RepID=A0ABX1K6K1_9MICO|nr:hypothetical protein [Microbacterium sp. CFH 90308]NLP82617.1 hypothetical protein [Microbacterium sp. CFH 90308]